MTALDELLGSPESVGTWNLVPEQSTIGFRCRSLWGLLPVHGRFREFDGDGQISAARMVFGRLDIAAATLDTRIARRDAHLRSADFFDVARFPLITVHVTGLDGTRGDTADLRATLTVRDTTAAIPLPVTVALSGDGALRLAAVTTINRKDFGVDGNLLGMVVDHATLRGDLVFRQAAGVSGR